MLHLVRNYLFRLDSPLHQEFSISLEQLIATRNTHRETEWFPSIFHDLHTLQAAVSDLQAKCVVAGPAGFGYAKT